MAKSTHYNIEPLKKENYDTWCVQAQAVLIKNGLWEYVDGSKTEPVGDVDKKEFKRQDQLARSEILLLISPSELKQIRNSSTSKEVWDKLKNCYHSQGPARKATLLKQVILKKMTENENVRDHLNNFLEIVDKLRDMQIEINPELLSVIMLYSLPQSYENFRIAIETRDTLPSPETLKIKIIEESEARKSGREKENNEAFYSKKYQYKNRMQQYGKNGTEKNTNTFLFKCHKCHKKGHKAINCNEIKGNSSNSNFKVEEACLTPNVAISKEWCLDSGCTSHMCKNNESFVNYTEQNNTLKLAAEDQTATVTGHGKVIITTNDRKINLWNTLHVPNLSSNLMSVAKITENGHIVTFYKEKAIIKNENGDKIMEAIKKNGLYYVQEIKENVNKILEENNIEKWHVKLAHINEQNLKSALRNKSIRGLNFKMEETLPECEVCTQSKMTRLPFPSKHCENRTTQVLEIIHSDVCGPMRIESLGGTRYFVTFIDEYTRYCRVYFLKRKNEVLEKFKEYKNEVENYTEKKIKFLQTDNGIGEYMNKEFNDFLCKYGIQRRLTTPYTPQQNGLAERKNRTLLEKARCMLIQARMPEKFWAEAVFTANYIANRIPTRMTKDKTPFEKWVGRVPSVNHFHVFGSKVYVLRKNKNYSKFSKRADEGIFVGYSEIRKAFRIWMPNQNKIICSRDMKVLNKMYYNERKEQNNIEIELLPTNNNLENEDNTEKLNIEFNSNESLPFQVSLPFQQSSFQELHTSSNGENSNDVDEVITTEQTKRSKRNRRPPAWIEDYDMTTCMCEENESEWEEAIKAEIKAHLRNNTWKIIEKGEHENIVSCKMILKEKINVDGNTHKKKARLVARGFSQIPGTDFNETFAPVSRLSSIRTLLAVSVEKGYKLNQLDVTTAYLNGELKENLFMEMPKNLDIYLQNIILGEAKNEDKTILNKAKEMLNDLRKNGNKKICKLQKAIYGLKQSGREWYEKLDNTLQKLGFQTSQAEPCIYTLSTGRDIVIIAIYVDDLITAYSNEKIWKNIKKTLTETFEMKDIGKLSYCLGIKFETKENEITMTQSEYTKAILRRYNMENCKSVCTPLEPSVKLEKSTKNTNINEYQSLIGSLMYLAVATRPDIMFTVSYLSQFNAANDETHWQCAKRVIRYLKGTINLGLTFKKTGHQLMGFADADWASCSVDRKSYTGYCFKYGGGIISWESKKQRTVALSTAEAEYMALTEAAKEAIHLKFLLNDLKVPQETITIWNDNQAAQNLANNPVTNKRSKHISIKEHFIRDSVRNNLLRIEYKNTEELEADMFTKALPSPRLNKLVKEIGM